MLNLENIARSVSGDWLVTPADLSRKVRVETDSRKDCSGLCFVAFAGDVFDAHQFIGQVIEGGAAMVCVEQIPSEEQFDLAVQYNCGVLLVVDTVKAYQNIASSYLEASEDCQVIGITGSSGKTSVKAILSSLLETVYPTRILSTMANTNNHIGVPQNVLRLNKEDLYAVLEMGTNNPGEIAVLAQCASPDIAVITSIGNSHCGNFGEGGILQEKLDIIRFMKPGATAVIPYSCLKNIAATGVLENRSYVTFGDELAADYSVVYGKSTLHGAEITLKKKGQLIGQLSTSLTGLHQAVNLSACVAVMDLQNINFESYRQSIESLVLPGMRMKVTQVGGVTWINDAYNANPQSTFAFINWLKELFLESKGQFYLVLGDMLELGALSQKFHDEIVPYIPDEWQVIVVGDFYSLSFGRKAQCFANSEDALAGLANLAAGDAVALKGSRGMRLEMIFKHFEDKEH